MARDIDVPERTLRRAVQRGTVRCRRPGLRQLELTADERAYLREHWNTISALTEALRTERNVRLAVLFGSLARGHGGEDSDVDVLVALAEERPMYLSYLAARLTRALGRDAPLLAMRQLGADFDRAAWQTAYEAFSAEEHNRVVQVTGNLRALVDNAVELVRFAATLTGLRPTGRRPSANADIEAQYVSWESGLSGNKICASLSARAPAPR